MIANHGEVELKNDLMGKDGVLIPSGKKGIVTAYMPTDRIFAVYFGPGEWITFTDESELDFNARFKWIKNLIDDI